jgi:ATP-dependent helicase/nuclease subunit B
MIRREAERLSREGAKAPVIGAGSTGSVPATAALLAAIAKLENGAVVLPGLDQGLDAESFEAIGVSDGDPAGAGHPQYGLKLLLQTIGVARSDVRPLAEAEGNGRSRDRLVSEAMRPASTAERWIEGAALTGPEKAAATAHIGLIEAANEREEALAAAVLLRRAAETSDHVSALVTPDRGLARRVAVELGRWGIDVDDSAGQPLARTSPGIFARLVAEAALNGAAGETLLALLKHPLAAFGLAPGEARRAARSLERAVLRGPRLRPGSAALCHALEMRFGERYREGEDKEFPTEAARGLSRAKWEAARDLASRIEAALRPLEDRAREAVVALPDLVNAHIEATIAAAMGSKGLTRLFSDEAGEALELFLERLRSSASSGPKILPTEYPGLFAALLERETVRPRRGGDPRIHIWGALEARLQRVDMVVLGGLNEGTWPSQTRRDPLLARPMREALSLEPPERRIGLAAHDFAQALGQPEVWLTRADRQDGEPRVASRWLQRLTAYAGEELSAEMRKRGEGILRLARSLDASAVSDLPKRPRPSPPVEQRPKRLSATRIETLIRDPYAIYAQYVLKLRPFEPLARLPEAQERGTLIHDILEEFVRERPAGPFDGTAEERLLAIGRERFREQSDFPEVIALWWPRFQKIARWFVREEAKTTDVLTRNVECLGELQVTPDFLLSARADRLDTLTGGGLSIIDYKTGSPPSFAQVRALSPQLPLEALIAQAGGFEGIPPTGPDRIVYYRLSGKGEGGESKDLTSARKGGSSELAETLEITRRRLRELVDHFASPEAGYISNKIPKPRRTFVGDYDHLARISEWIATDEEDDSERPG